MAIRIEWDEFEIALLIEACEEVLRKGKPKSEVVKTVSSNLRKRAISKNIAIDDVFRNENGIALQMQKMAYLLTHGEKGMPGASKLYAEVAELREENPKKFEEILKRAKEEIEMTDLSQQNIDKKALFAQWLNEHPIKKYTPSAIIDALDVASRYRILTKNTTFADTIRAWVDKLSQICIAYSVIKNELGDAKPFYEMLCSLYKQRNLLDSQKKPFLALLQENANTFKQFMAAQSSLFMKACSYYLDDLSEEDAKAILDDDTYGFGSSYLLEPDKYTSKVQKAVTAYKNAQKYTQLKKHWLDLTGTDSPYAWSNKYGMPILAMVPDAEMSIARKVFGFINSKTKDEESIATAEDYLSKITYADKLSSKSERDKAFRDVFLGDYTILFDDVDEVIDYLKSHVTESPYHWMGSKEVSVKIKEMANANYVKSGYSEAKQVIDNMPVDQLKDYLKKLIEDNIAVGVEIIKGQK